MTVNSSASVKQLSQELQFKCLEGSFVPLLIRVLWGQICKKIVIHTHTHTTPDSVYTQTAVIHILPK